ncbi:MAG TPA: hypothetical protein VF131_20025 [Blastocatellia bacterium]|nr:hypothetical protein [Blastocatellia bacterium]
MKRIPVLLIAALLLLISFSSATEAETLRRRYTFAYNRATRKASSTIAAAKARKQLLRDFLAEKFSPEITSRYPEDIDIALDPPDQYLTSFDVISERTNDDETQVTLTVEGDVDLALMISALVQNKVLSFGKDAPKVMVLPSSRFEDPKAAKTLRALMNDKIKQAGLRPVAFESATESVSFKIKDRVTPTEVERKALIRQATQYGADYLIYIDTEAETKPFSQGGYISDANFIHTILRPNGSLILGESLVSERGSGSSPMLAFDRALDSVAPVIAKVAVGQLFQAIYSDSEVIYSTPKLREEKTLVIYWAAAPLVEQIVERLKNTGASAAPGTGMSENASRFKVETEMDDFDLYEWFNAQSFTVGGKTYKTPVVAYSENVIEVEAVAQQAQPRRPVIGKAPARKPKNPAGGPTTRPSQAGPAGDQLAKVTLRLRPAQFNR